MSRCNFCWIHIPAGRLINRRRTDWCDNNTHMRWQRRNVGIVYKCTVATFSLTGEDGAGCVEGVESFRYLGRIMHLSGEYCLEVLRNIWR